MKKNIDDMRLRDHVAYATRQHLYGEDDVREFLSICINDLGLGMGFHPDTGFEDYIYKKNNRKIFNAREAKEMNITLEEAFEICKKLGLDIYSIGLQILDPILKEAFGEEYKKEEFKYEKR